MTDSTVTNVENAVSNAATTVKADAATVETDVSNAATTVKADAATVETDVSNADAKATSFVAAHPKAVATGVLVIVAGVLAHFVFKVF